MLPTSQKYVPEHHTMDPLRSRLIMAFNLGLLLFKNLNPHQMARRNMVNKEDRACLYKCGETDSFEHVMKCAMYKTKYKHDKPSAVVNTAEFLFNLNKERIEVFHQPLLYSL